jgi:hypothetical protein
MDTFRVERYGKTKFFAVRDAADALVCLCVYKRGAQEVARRLQVLDEAQRWADANGPAHEVTAPAVGVDPAPWLR